MRVSLTKPYRAIILLALSTLLAADAVAQATQYTAPGGSNLGGTRSKEDLEREMAEARWSLGPVRLAPWIGVRDLAWVDNVYAEGGDETSDVTVTAGAGLTAYLPTGPKIFWLAQAMPEYVWWADSDERRRLVGRYGVGGFGSFNRLELAVRALRTEEQAVVTSESPQLAIAQREEVGLDGELRLLSTLALTVAAADTDLEQESDEPFDPRVPDFSRLDRGERRLGAGLAWRPNDQVRLELGAEHLETEFAPGARDLSGSGTSPYLALEVVGNRLSTLGRLVQRRLDPEPGSVLVPVEALEGDLRLELRPGWRFTFGAYGSQLVTYSLAEGQSHFEARRFGADVAAPFAGRFDLRLFGETGENRYEPLAAAAPRRLDEVTAYGVRLGWRLREWLSYRAGFVQEEYDSNLPGFDREVGRIESTLVVSTGSWAWQ
ncbi:MAG TPA: hypothetical protein VHQ65_13480 [Thermoanaerobaculia bacterium]|nr:hypothetical protein [Thermoanaerobaculia bacterium]